MFTGVITERGIIQLGTEIIHPFQTTKRKPYLEINYGEINLYVWTNRKSGRAIKTLKVEFRFSSRVGIILFKANKERWRYGVFSVNLDPLDESLVTKYENQLGDLSRRAVNYIEIDATSNLVKYLAILPLSQHASHDLEIIIGYQISNRSHFMDGLFVAHALAISNRSNIDQIRKFPKADSLSPSFTNLKVEM